MSLAWSLAKKSLAHANDIANVHNQATDEVEKKEMK